MPKMKTKSSVKKRFKITATGKVLAGPGNEAPWPDQPAAEDEAAGTRQPDIDPCGRPDRQAMGPLRPAVRGT